MKLITGHSGQNHISADDDASKLKALIGSGEFVLDKGSKFAYQISSNNLIILSGGDAIFQGRHCRTKADERENCAIENGTQGQIRHDLICIKYSQLNGVESTDIVVVKGTPGPTGTDPSYAVGDIENGDTEHFMPLYRVVLNGLNVESVQSLYKVYHKIPNFSYGTADPSGGEDGDVYFKIIE